MSEEAQIETLEALHDRVAIHDLLVDYCRFLEWAAPEAGVPRAEAPTLRPALRPALIERGALRRR